MEGINFDYACIAACPPDVQIDEQPEGLEIDFELLRSLAAVHDQYETKEGIIFGVDTALFPAGQERRWHLLRTDKIRGISGLLFNAHSRLKRSASAPHKLPEGKVYVGWCDTPLIKSGTTIPADLPRSAVPPHPGFEEISGRSVAKQGNMTITAGAFGTSASVSGGQTRTKMYKSGPVQAARSKDQDFHRVLSNASETPCILWDDSVKRAWLLPAVSALLFASLCYVKINKYEFKAEPVLHSASTSNTEAAQSRSIGARFGVRSMVASLLQSINSWIRTQPASTSDIKTEEPTYAQPSNNANKSAVSCLRDNYFREVLTADGWKVPENEPITFRDIVMRIWGRMVVAEELCYSPQSTQMLGSDDELLGYDLREAISDGPIYLRSINVNAMPSLSSWCRLARARRLQIIFCGKVGSVIECSSPNCSPCCSEACQTQSAARGTLSCLLQDLKSFYGEAGWNSPLCLPIGPIGSNLGWIPSGHECLSHSNTGLLKADGPCACCADLDRLQSIALRIGMPERHSAFAAINRKWNAWVRKISGQRRPMQEEVSEWLDNEALQGYGAIRFGRSVTRPPE